MKPRYKVDYLLIGSAAGDDVLNPGRLDANGDPKVIMRKGEEIMREHLIECSKWGVEQIPVMRSVIVRCE